MKMPELSIITVTYNCRDLVELTIKNVAKLPSSLVEHIVIDGLSTDGTFELIESYAGTIAYAVSEKDAGIFDAMNKGVRAARGNYVLFLNAGDVIDDLQILLNLEYSIMPPVYYFGFKISGDDREFKPGIKHPFGLPTSHQATIMNKKIVSMYPFSVDLKVAADFEQYLRISRDRAIKYVYDDRVLVKVLPGGYSFKHKKLMEREYSKILYSHSIFKWFLYNIWRASLYSAIVKFKNKII